MRWHRRRWRPRAAATKVSGGWRLSGRWTFSSGCDHAQWVILGVFLGEMGDPNTIAYLLVPLAECEIDDDWHVLGLAGTGSKTVVLKDVFVPEHRHVMVADLFAGTPPGATVHPDYPVVRAPRGYLVSYSLPPVAIALGRRALDLVCRDLSTRMSRGVTRMADSEFVQMAVGEAAAAIDAATLLLHHGREHSTAEVDTGRRIGHDEAVRARRDMVYAQHQVGWALERLCELSGARWLYDTDPLQEVRRDVMAILTHHAANRAAAYAPYGHMLMAHGAEPGTAAALEPHRMQASEGEFMRLSRGGGCGGVLVRCRGGECPNAGAADTVWPIWRRAGLRPARAGDDPRRERFAVLQFRQALHAGPPDLEPVRRDAGARRLVGRHRTGSSASPARSSRPAATATPSAAPRSLPAKASSPRRI